MGGFNEVQKSFLNTIIMNSSIMNKKNTQLNTQLNESDLIFIVKKMLNVFLVQGAGVNELLFAGCSRKGMMEEKVLVTVTSDR